MWPNQLEQLYEQYISTLDSPTVLSQAQESVGKFVALSKKSSAKEITYQDIQKFCAYVHSEYNGYARYVHMRTLRTFLRFAARKGIIKIDPECIVIDESYGAVSIKEILNPIMKTVRFSTGQRTDKKKIREFYYYRFVKKLKYDEIEKKMKKSRRQLTRYKQYLEIAGKDKLIGPM